MLDKSLPYFNIIMKRDSGLRIPQFSLPRGYTFCWYTEGDENSWAEIETSVGEFNNIGEALKYFEDNYLPFKEELKRRLLFVQNDKGMKVGTITSWWNIDVTGRVPSIHWFSVNEEYQGYGLGKALVSKSLQILVDLEGDKDIFLHTQTWSYRAVGLYQKFSFEILSTGTFADYKNDYDKAIPYLKKYLMN